MARLITTGRTIAALYSFAVDGGATGDITMGVFIPNNAVVGRFAVKTNTTFTSGGAATVSWGFAADTDAYMVVQAFGNFIAAQTISGVDLNANPLEATANRELTITIATAALTAGIAIAMLTFIELDI